MKCLSHHLLRRLPRECSACVVFLSSSYFNVGTAISPENVPEMRKQMVKIGSKKDKEVTVK